jgi:heat shock protein HslJ
VIRTLQVAASRIECTGVAQQLCLQVRESSDQPWTLLYDAIEGFDYEPGFLYELRVKVEAVANAPADASSLRRTLVAILSKTRASSALLGSTWRLSSINGREALAGVRVTAVFAAERVAGSAGCNRYFGGATVDGAQLNVGLLASTMMHCGDVVMPQEHEYLSTLEKAKAYRILGSELRLGPSPDSTTLVFRLE